MWYAASRLANAEHTFNSLRILCAKCAYAYNVPPLILHQSRSKKGISGRDNHLQLYCQGHVPSQGCPLCRPADSDACCTRMCARDTIHLDLNTWLLSACAWLKRYWHPNVLIHTNEAGERHTSVAGQQNKQKKKGKKKGISTCTCSSTQRKQGRGIHMSCAGRKKIAALLSRRSRTAICN